MTKRVVEADDESSESETVEAVPETKTNELPYEAVPVASSPVPIFPTPGAVSDSPPKDEFKDNAEES